MIKAPPLHQFPLNVTLLKQTSLMLHIIFKSINQFAHFTLVREKNKVTGVYFGLHHKHCNLHAEENTKNQRWLT